MIRAMRRVIFALLAALLLGQAALAAQPIVPGRGPALTPALTQVGVIDALLAGAYDGFFPLSRLTRAGNFGLGTFHRLDGEMVVLDGVVYQVPADGKVRRPAPGVTTPFAQVVRFRPSGSAELVPGSALKQVEAALDAAIGDANVFAAARVDAEFETLTARSVPAQSPPYRPLAEVAKGQSVFPFAGVSGTLVGLRGPAFAKGLGVPGWHWHFLTRDRARGGHVLDFRLAPAGPRVRAGYMTLRRLELALPPTGMSGLDLARDRTGELKAVETVQE